MIKVQLNARSDQCGRYPVLLGELFDPVGSPGAGQSTGDFTSVPLRQSAAVLLSVGVPEELPALPRLRRCDRWPRYSLYLILLLRLRDSAPERARWS